MSRASRSWLCAAAHEVARRIQTSRALCRGAVPDDGLPQLPARMRPEDEVFAEGVLPV